MIATFVHDGDSIDHTPVAALAAGTVIVLANAIGIATRPIPANTLGTLALAGVFDLPRDPSGLIAQGTTLFWDAAAQRATIDAAAGTNLYLGISAMESPDTAAAIRVRLNH
jgi:predicted RecA/RadA family phage recombinase